jgi:predicted nucleic acid-binding protein
MDYVIDASAWLRYVLQDGPAYDEVADAFLPRHDITSRVHAPQHLVAEVAHVLHRLRVTGRLTSAQAAEHLERLLSLPIRYHPLPDMAAAAFRLAWEHRLSVYDSLYLVLSMGTRSRLLTVDDDLARAARAEGCA